MGNFGSEPLNFSASFHSFLLFSLNFVNIHDKYFFIIYLMVKVQCLSIELALGLIH